MNYGFVYIVFMYYYLEWDKVLGIKYLKVSGDVYGYFLKDNIIGIFMIMVKWECFKKVGLFREDFVICEDWDMWLRMVKVCCFGVIDEFLVDYFIYFG